MQAVMQHITNRLTSSISKHKATFFFVGTTVCKLTIDFKQTVSQYHAIPIKLLTILRSSE
jgi:hypothetical protein